MNTLVKAAIVAATAAAIGIGSSLPATAHTTSEPAAVAATSAEPIDPAITDAASDPMGGATIMAGSSTQSRNGLTCRNEWFNTLGRTNCTGNPNQRWRLKLFCQFQGDILGTWQQGPGSDQGECNFRISSASIVWG